MQRPLFFWMQLAFSQQILRAVQCSSKFHETDKPKFLEHPGSLAVLALPMLFVQVT